VDQILSQYYGGLPEKTTTSYSDSSKGEKNIAASLLKLLDLGAKFGRDTATIYSQELRETRVSKLLSALQVLGQRVKDLDDLIESDCDISSLESGIFLYSGAFRVNSFDNDYAYLVSFIPSGQMIQAVCSLRYFSEIGRDKETFAPHSGNVEFFKGDFELPFISLLYLIKNLEGIMHTTPLFLALALNSEVLL
jgi:hypothetical protein